MRTLDDPLLESVQVEVRPVGRCYLVIDIAIACQRVAPQSPGPGGGFEGLVMR